MPELLTPAEVGERLGVSDETIRRWAKSGALPSILLPSGRYVFRPDDIAAILVPRPGHSAAS